MVIIASMPTFTREELYTLVWSDPILKIAPRYGLSDRGFGKLCARYNIPVPPRGYWAKRSAGKRVKQPPLPRHTDASRQEIHLKEKTGMPRPKPTTSEVHPLIVFEQEPANRLTLPDDLVLNNPMVAKTERLLKRSRRDPMGLIGAPAGGLRIHTSRDQHERALRVMQTLLAAFESRQWPVIATAEGVRVQILDETLGFGLEEGTKKIPHPITFTEQKLIDRGAGWQVPKTDSVPSGVLTLVITNVRHCRQRWTESPSKPLEQVLNKFMIGVIRAALAVKQQRAEAERRERERQDEERQRIEAERRRKIEAQRNREELAARDRFDNLTAEWQRNEQRQAFLLQLRQAMGEVAIDSALGQWLAWADRYIESADPLERFRRREPALKLYYSGYGFEFERIRGSGFAEPEPQSPYVREPPPPPGIRLQDKSAATGYSSSSLEIEVPEEAVLQYEVTDPGYVPRVFYVPASVLNRLLGKVG